MLFSKKKKVLNVIYNKIVEESKGSLNLIFEKPHNTDQFMEFFQLNLILILWFMKQNNIDNKNLDYLITIFVKDLEGMVIELGASETSLRKKIRVIIENFYGRLYSYTELFDHYESNNYEIKKNVIKKNFHFLSNLKPIIKYLNTNILYLRKLQLDDFWEANFIFRVKKVF